MFKAKIDGKILKESINAIAVIVEEGRIKINKEGVKLRAVDLANVAMVSFDLSKEAFEEFQIERELDGDLELPIDLNRLNSIIKSSIQESIILKLDEKVEKLYTRMNSLNYTLSLLDTLALRKEPKVPELEHPIKLTINLEELKRTAKAADKISELITFGVKKEQFYIEAKGDTDKLLLNLNKDQLKEFNPKDLILHSSYSLCYMLQMIKGMEGSNNITLRLGNDYPLQIDFKIAGGKGKISYLLAPRISD